MTLITDEQFYSELPPNGLALAEENLQRDYETLLEHGLPVSGTVAGLLLVRSLQDRREEEETYQEVRGTDVSRNGEHWPNFSIMR